MKLILESTSKIVEVVGPHDSRGAVPCRIWEGETDTGIKVHAYITRVAVPNDADQSQFQRELQSHRAPSPEIEAIPLRLIL